MRYRKAITTTDGMRNVLTENLTYIFGIFQRCTYRENKRIESPEHQYFGWLYYRAH